MGARELGPRFGLEHKSPKARGSFQFSQTRNVIAAVDCPIELLETQLLDSFYIPLT